MGPFVLLSFFLGMLILLTYTHAVRGRPTLKDVIERLFWHWSVREPKESYTENKCALYEQICENYDMNYTAMNCFETKCQIREARTVKAVRRRKWCTTKSVPMPYSLSCSKTKPDAFDYTSEKEGEFSNHLYYFGYLFTAITEFLRISS